MLTPCCSSRIPLKTCCVGVVACPECETEYRYSWCSQTFCDEEKRPRNHCEICQTCRDYREQHCYVSDFFVAVLSILFLINCYRLLQIPLVGTLKDKFMFMFDHACILFPLSVVLKIVLIAQAVKESWFSSFFPTLKGRRDNCPNNCVEDCSSADVKNTLILSEIISYWYVLFFFSAL